MPDLDILIEMEDYYNIDLRELLDGERKSEKMNDEKTKEAVDDMSILIQKMNVMLDSVGKKILSVDNSNEYENVVERQNIIAASKNISRGINLQDVSWMDTETERRKNVSDLLDILAKALSTGILEKLFSSDSAEIGECFGFFSQEGMPISSIAVNLSKDIKGIDKILMSPNSRKLLEEELIKDEYYEEMQPEVHEKEEEFLD